MAIKGFTIRIDEDMLNRLHSAAYYEGRSCNSQVLILIRDFVEAHEKKQSGDKKDNK